MINDLKTIMKIQGISSREHNIAAKLTEMIKSYFRHYFNYTLLNLTFLPLMSTTKFHQLSII